MNKYTDKDAIVLSIKKTIKSCPSLRLQDFEIETSTYEGCYEGHSYFLTFVVGGKFKTLPFSFVSPATFAASDEKDDGTLTFEWKLRCNDFDTMLSDVGDLIVTINEVMTDLYSVDKIKEEN